jgi:hypothetical protein
MRELRAISNDFMESGGGKSTTSMKMNSALQMIEHHNDGGFTSWAFKYQSGYAKSLNG